MNIERAKCSRFWFELLNDWAGHNRNPTVREGAIATVLKTKLVVVALLQNLGLGLWFCGFAPALTLGVLVLWLEPPRLRLGFWFCGLNPQRLRLGFWFCGLNPRRLRLGF